MEVQEDCRKSNNIGNLIVFDFACTSILVQGSSVKANKISSKTNEDFYVIESVSILFLMFMPYCYLISFVRPHTCALTNS